MREILIGFDSAWANSSKNPGAIAAYVFETGKPAVFHPPRLGTFDATLQFIDDLASKDDYLLIAIDQPTIVPNDAGSRPVDRVAASLVSRLKGGVQPARRGGMGAPMFGDNAPVWNFLAVVDAIQNPIDARNAAAGRFVMEVFPALALPAIVPALWNRGQAARYNPAASKFDPLDWPLVATGLAAFARNLGAVELADWADAESARAMPRKADQDRLDAAICLAIAQTWRHGPVSDTLLIGDERTGYMAAIVSGQTRSVLVEAAATCGVAVDRAWKGTATPAAVSASTPPQQTIEAIAMPMKNSSARVDRIALRAFLIECARSDIVVEYGQVATRFGQPWSRGFSSSLTSALDALGVENTRAGEPLLMCLVVNKTTRQPGQKYFATIGHGSTDAAGQASAHSEEVDRCRRWPWA